MEKKTALFIILFSITAFIITIQPGVALSVDFSFEKHWNLPIPPQGSPPVNFSDLEASLDSKDCGSCHEHQFEDWKTSLHSKSMGPALAGQLHPPWIKNPLTCTNCHAPLSEQSPVIKSQDGDIIENPGYQPELQHQGLTCAGCHVRKHIRYGPKPLEGKVEDPPHNSFVEVENFGDSQFCKPCHQFNPGEKSINEKLLQNTYEEWKKSSYPKKGIHCSDCHMPDRKHLWQGIHNPEMVKKGITIEAKREGTEIFLTIVNSGVGHNFPTYVTPKIVIRSSVLDKNRNEVPQSVEEKFIGWNVPVNLSKEWYDTRIPPGEMFSARLKIRSSVAKGKFRLLIRVFPDDFYTRFFKTLLNNPPEGIDVKKIKEAYNRTLKSNYILFEKSWDL